MYTVIPAGVLVRQVPGVRLDSLAGNNRLIAVKNVPSQMQWRGTKLHQPHCRIKSDNLDVVG